MARSTSDEEIQLKKRARRRLVGAVVLATTVAVVLPMVLDTEPKPVSNNVNIQIPSPDAPRPAEAPVLDGAKEPAAVGEPAAAPKGESKEAAPAAKADAAPAKPAKAKPDEPARPAEKTQAEMRAAKEATQAADKPAEKEAPKAETRAPAKAPAKADAKEAAKAPAQPAGGKFVVQVAALADAAKARQLQQRVAGTGVKTYTEVVKTAKGNVTRVRAGPFDSREAAEKARVRLKSAGLDGKVVPR